MDQTKFTQSAYLFTPIAFFCGGLFLMLIGFLTIPQKSLNIGSVFLFIFGGFDLISGVILYRIQKNYWMENNRLLIGKKEVIIGLVLSLIVILITTFLKSLVA
jgi:uncharacterized membrane protein